MQTALAPDSRCCGEHRCSQQAWRDRDKQGDKPWTHPLSRPGKNETARFLFDGARNQLPGICWHTSAVAGKTALSFRSPGVLPQCSGQAGAGGEKQGWFIQC